MWTINLLETLQLEVKLIQNIAKKKTVKRVLELRTPKMKMDTRLNLDIVILVIKNII
jgi:hypothetical protein